MKWVILALLMVSFVSAVEIELDCPDEIFVDEEFECSLEVFDGEGEYDVKIDLDGERRSVAQLWNKGEWKSGYYYLKDFIENGDERDIRMKISEEGDYDGELKLRQGDKREFFDIEIEVKENEDIINDSVALLEDVVEVISLNSEIVVEVDELIYVSKDAKIKDWLPYGFSLFLIVVIGILLWERF